MTHDIVIVNSLEIIDLAARQDGRQNLVLLSSGHNELGVGGRFLQRFKESVEGSTREHVYLIYDVHLVFGTLRRNAHLVDQIADALHGVVGGGIEFEDVERGRVVESSI